MSPDSIATRMLIKSQVLLNEYFKLLCYNFWCLLSFDAAHLA